MNTIIFKNVVPYLDLSDIVQFCAIDKKWNQFVTEYLSKNRSIEKKWIINANQLINNPKLIKLYDDVRNDYAFLNELGLMIKVYYCGDSTIEIDFVCLCVKRYLRIEIPHTKETFPRVYYFMHLMWHQGQKIVMINTRSYFIKLNLSDLDNISYELIKKSKNTRKITNGFSYDHMGTHFIYDNNGKKILSITTKNPKNGGLLIHHKFKKSKVLKLKLHDFTFNQVVVFGESDKYSLFRYNYEIVILDNSKPLEFQRIDLPKSATITAYYWDTDEQKICLLMKRRWHSIRLDESGKWLAVKRNEQKVDYNYGCWDSKLRRFIRFERINNNDDEALEVSDWISHTKMYHLTINDIIDLKLGDQTIVVQLDQDNLFNCEDCNEPSIICEPTEFFQDVVGVYTHEENLKGRFQSVDIDRDFEFDVEYKKNHWYPLTEGRLPADDDDCVCAFGDKCGWHWNQFPIDTRIGWRGPMIETSKLQLCPKVYWLENKPYLLS